MASVSWVMSAAAPARSGLINPAGLPGPEIQEEPLLAGYVTGYLRFDVGLGGSERGRSISE